MSGNIFSPEVDKGIQVISYEQDRKERRSSCILCSGYTAMLSK